MSGVDLPKEINVVFSLTSAANYEIILKIIVLIVLFIIFCISLSLNIYFIYESIKKNRNR